MNKKNIFLWASFDFANSISTVVFFVYFSQWLVIDNKLADIWFNLIFVGSSILLIFTSPIAGSIADKIGTRMQFLKVLTVFQFITLLITSLIAILSPANTKNAFLAAFAFLLSNYFYQFSFTFYNPLLNDIAPRRKQGFVSGIGQSANWLGEIAGILLTLPFIAGAVFFIGNSGRAQTFLPATILFFLISLPMLFLFKEKNKPRNIRIDLLSEYKNALKSFISLCKSPGVGRFLLGYFFFNDAMLTVVNNFPIYLEQVFRVSDQIKSYLLIGILMTSAIGALIVGWFSDKVGLKKTLIIILTFWIVIFPVSASINNFNYFVAITILIGFFFGATWTVTRSIMSYLSPPQRLNQAFSYYTMFERFSTFVGPLTWGIITFVLVNTGNFRYHVAVASMTIFIIIGLLIVKSIPSKSS